MAPRPYFLSTLRPRRRSGRALALVTVLASVVVGGCRAPAATPALARFEYEEPHMGTSIRVVLFAPDTPTADVAARAAFERFAALDACMSDYDPESEISRLGRSEDGAAASAAGGWTTVSRELFDVLALALDVSRASNGAFDVTVGPLSRVWRRAVRRSELPGDDDVERARASVGYAGLELADDPPRVRLRLAGMRLDLGGIAKGYAADAALAALRANGVERALVDAGGDLVVGEPPPGTDGWRVELARLSERGDEAPPRLELARCSVATSGDLSRYVEIDGVRYSHLIDPRSGSAVRERRLVTVVARDGATADALASALSVMDAEAGRALVAERDGVEARIVRLVGQGKSVWCSAGFPRPLSSPDLPSPAAVDAPGESPSHP